MLLFLAIVGAATGSFIGALTWRWPKDISILDGRSRCPHCSHTIRWYDNIPVFSYLFLHGKCRDCGKPIPKRDFFIEASTALLFPAVYILLPEVSMNTGWLLLLGENVRLVATLIVFAILAAIFVIDLEHQYIPDSLVFVLWLFVVAVQLITNNSLLFHYLAAGFGAGVFLLFLHLATLGRGMGLGDVKLALALGSILGFPLSVVWMFSSFVLGSIVGISLMALGRAKLKQKIAFGPFLIAGFLVTSVVGFDILNLLGV